MMTLEEVKEGCNEVPLRERVIVKLAVLAGMRSATLIKPVCKSKTRRPIILIAVDSAGVDSDRGQTGIWILYAWVDSPFR